MKSKNTKRVERLIITFVCLCLFYFLTGINITCAQALLDSLASWSSGPNNYTTSIAWGDMDGDGDLDLACGNGNNHGYVLLSPNTVFINNDGVLETIPFWFSRQENDTWSIAWGDIDGDGYLDLACGNDGHNKVYFNKYGILEREPSWSSAPFNWTRSISLGDVDGDGDLDLACGNGSHDTNTVYLNNNGVLETVPSWSSGRIDSTWSIEWGDMDGDGDLDLACGNSGSNTVYINKEGLLEKEPYWYSGPENSTSSIAWGDVDGDGDLDLACGNSGSNTVYINYDGLLETEPYWYSGPENGTTSIAWGDVDGDGDLDLACGNGWGDPNTVYLNNDGILETEPSWYSWLFEYNSTTASIAWGDVDGDGDLDLAYANSSYPNTVHLNNSWVLETQPSWSPRTSDHTSCVAWGDVDGDGDMDLAYGNSLKSNTVYLNNDGVLDIEPSWSSGPANETNSVAWGDVNGDGNLDLACGNIGSNTVYINNNGILEKEPSWVSGLTNETMSIAWGDIDGDGDLDLACGNTKGDVRMGESNTIYINNNGVLETEPSWFSRANNHTWCVAWGDLDGDSDLDLACGNVPSWAGYGPNTVYLNNNGILETEASWFSKANCFTACIAWGDVDGDGDLDLACGNSSDPNIVYRNIDGILDIEPSWFSGNASQTRGISWGDVDGDGDLDLACGNDWGDPNTVYLNNDGILETEPSWFSKLSSNTMSIAWGDVDGDGDLDLACGSSSYYSEEKTLYLNKLNRKELLNLPNNWSFIRSLSKVHNDSIGNTLEIRYKLVDDEGDCCKIIAEYSPYGGGQWFKATQIGGSDINDLKTNSVGVDHIFIWDLEADNAQGFNVLFRMKIFSNPDHTGLIQRPFTTYQFPIGLIDSKPYISIIYPLSNATVGGVVPIIGSVCDATNFDRYEIELNNNLVYQEWKTKRHVTELYSLDTAQIPPGKYNLLIKAFDKRNNQHTVSIPLTIVPLPDEPKVILKFPDNSSQNVALNSPIIAQLTSNMNSVALTNQTLVIRDANQKPVFGDIDYNYHTRTLTFVPSAPFSKNSFYYVTIDSSFQNEDGSSLKVNTTWGFTTEDKIQPFDDIIKTIPGNGFLSVSVADSIKVILDSGSPYQHISLRKLDGKIVPGETIIIPSPGTNSKMNLIFIPNTDLEGATLYLAKVSADTSVEDAGSYMFYFITEDVKTLEITEISPQNGNIIPPIDFEISATFSKDMNPNTLDSNSVLLMKEDKRVSAFISYIVEEKKVLITPQRGLEPNSTYSVSIRVIVQSRGGLSLGSNYMWNFHTAPIITNAGGTITSLDSMVEMEFPPNALTKDIHIIIQKDTTNFDQFKPTDPKLELLSPPYSFEPLPLIFDKPVVLRMKTAMNENLSNIDIKKLAIFKWDEVNRNWLKIGGTGSQRADTVSVTTTLIHLDNYYAVLEDQSTGRTFSLTNIDTQPRIFSPQAGGYDTQTAISFELGKESNVTIKIYNAAGRLVKVLIENEQMSYGNNVVYWDGKDQQGEFCVSGLYIVTIQAEEKMATKTVVVLNK